MAACVSVKASSVAKDCSFIRLLRRTRHRFKRHPRKPTTNPKAARNLPRPTRLEQGADQRASIRCLSLKDKSIEEQYRTDGGSTRRNHSSVRALEVHDCV